ncbi:MAG TPA: BON domain-containing protein [Gemmatimonadales bacterium]|nr:BON domain-containing protein [Gemmatimonadales bacterium]
MVAFQSIAARLSRRRAKLRGAKSLWDFALLLMPSNCGGGLASEMWKADDGGVAVLDRRLQEQVFDAFWADPELRSGGLRVDVYERVVTLSGRVATDFEKRTAEKIAAGIARVRLVRNHIRVVPLASLIAADLLG